MDREERIALIRERHELLRNNDMTRGDMLERHTKIMQMINQLGPRVTYAEATEQAKVEGFDDINQSTFHRVCRELWGKRKRGGRPGPRGPRPVTADVSEASAVEQIDQIDSDPEPVPSPRPARRPKPTRKPRTAAKATTATATPDLSAAFSVLADVNALAARVGGRDRLRDVLDRLDQLAQGA